MPELPDLTIYIESLHSRITGERIENIRLGNPFILRTFDPPMNSAIGKRIVFELQDELFIVSGY